MMVQCYKVCLGLDLSLDQLISWRDVASWTFWRKSIRSSASLPAWVVVMSIQSFMSCSHLLVGLPLPLLPSILASKMCLSSVSRVRCAYLLCPVVVECMASLNSSVSRVRCAYLLCPVVVECMASLNYKSAPILMHLNSSCHFLIDFYRK